MKKMFWFLLIALLLAFIPLAVADEKPLPKPEALGEETILTSKRLSSYDTLIIKDFTR